MRRDYRGRVDPVPPSRCAVSDRLYVDCDSADQVVRIDVGLARPVTVNGRTFYPDPRGLAWSDFLHSGGGFAHAMTFGALLGSLTRDSSHS